MYFVKFVIAVSFFKSGFCQNDENFKIDSLPAGLYYSEIGSGYVSVGYYQLFNFYNVSELHEEREIWNKLKSDIKAKTAANISDTMSIVLHEIEKNLDHLEFVIKLCENGDTTIDRFKRGIFGKILTFFFGINDEAYEALNELQMQNQDLLQFTQDTSKIYKKKLKETQEVIQKKMNEFYDMFNQEHFENYLLHSLQYTDTKLTNIIRAINKNGDWNDFFSHKKVEEIVQKHNEILKNKVCMKLHFNFH